MSASCLGLGSHLAKLRSGALDVAVFFLSERPAAVLTVPTAPTTWLALIRSSALTCLPRGQVRAFCGTSDDVQTMAALRSAKDNFSGPTRPWMPVGGPESGR